MSTSQFLSMRMNGSRPTLRPFIRVVLTSLLVILVTGCSSHDTVTNTTDPHWAQQANPPAKVAVVFVHGLFGDTDGTWTNPNGQTFFELLKTVPNIGEKVDIFAFGFTSDTLKGGSLDIREAANMLEQSLQYNGVWNYPTVVFVAHSMGGLIVMREIIDNPAHREKVPLLMFYAVPQEGSQITAIARHVVDNPAVKQMLMADQNDFLQLLNDEWSRIPQQDRPTIDCAYETAPYAGVVIVPWSSATRFCSDVPIAIQSANHLTIVKPDRLTHPSMVVLVNALNKYVFDGNPNQPILSTPDFQGEGDHWTYELTDPNGKNEARLINSGTRKLSYTIEKISDPRLMVLPDDTPKEIPAQHSDAIKLVLMRGQLQEQYEFTLSVPPFGDRLIVVRVKNVGDVQAKQEAVTREVTAQLTNFLASPDNVAALNALPKDQQSERVADVAGAAISKVAPSLPSNAKWVVTADTLTSLGLLAPATTALQNARQTSPGIVNNSSAQLVAQTISARSGKPNVLQPSEEGVPGINPAAPVQIYAEKSEAMLSSAAAGSNIGSGDADARLKLSDQLKSVTSLQAYGYVMNGDVLRAQGDATAAKRAYQNAERIQPNPLTGKKVEAAKMDEARQGH